MKKFDTANNEQTYQQKKKSVNKTQMKKRRNSRNSKMYK